MKRNDRAQGKVKLPGAIAKKVNARLRKQRNAKLINLDDLRMGAMHSEELQETVASSEALKQFHPANAVYVHVQNQMSILAEVIFELHEMKRYVNFIHDAEEEYLPSGPPMSPLTNSYFTLWTLHDVAMGLSKETVGDILLSLIRRLGAHESFIELFENYQNSRMGIYSHEGFDGEFIRLCDIMTGEEHIAVNASGRNGEEGELWYARILPPPTPGDPSVLVITPYVLCDFGIDDWRAFFRRNLVEATFSATDPIYYNFMKFGPQARYWTEYVFTGYKKPDPGAVFLTGIPDLPDTLPHLD